MLNEFEKINTHPKPFKHYTAKELWSDEEIANRMLEFSHNSKENSQSRNKSFNKKSAEWIISHFNLNKNSKVIDFGCGTGYYTTFFAEANATVTGIDFCSSSIDKARRIAKQKELKINYLCQDYIDFKTEEKFDLVTMLALDFCTLSPKNRKKMLNKFKSILKPNGSILLDVHSLNSYNEREKTAYYEKNLLDGFWSSGKYHSFISTFNYAKKKIILDIYTILDNKHTKFIYNWIQCFDQSSIRNEFEKYGFKINEFFSDITGKTLTSESEEIAIVAKLT